jgi:hypothetical protein
MRKSVRSLALLVAASALVATVSCTDFAPTEPEQPTLHQSAPEQSNLLGGLIGGLLGPVLDIITRLVDGLIAPLTRTLALDNDISWSFVAGPGGAFSSNSRVGLTISIPQGALTTTRIITVTALEGNAVAYKFEPHGLVFQRPVTLKQSLSGVSGYSYQDVLTGAYFNTDRLVLSDGGLAQITELIPAQTNLFTKTVTFKIEHFSGYIVASGRSLVEREEESEGR